jgi:dienelactone hydrolase
VPNLTWLKNALVNKESIMRCLWTLLVAALLGSSWNVLGAEPAKPESLPGTMVLDWSDDIAVRVVDEAHRFLDRKTAESIAGRQKYWKRDFSSPEAYAKSVEPNRQRFKKLIGVVDPRVPVVMERYGDESHPALVAETNLYKVWQVRWSLLDGVTGEGLLVEPRLRAMGHVIAIPDADQTPQQLLGLSPGVPEESQFVRRLVTNGFRVVVPVLINRGCEFSGNPQIRMTNQPHREWIYRQAYELGRHIIGLEVQKVLAAVDWLERTAGQEGKIGVAGYGEGGLIAFYSAAVDPRIQACLVSGYFDNRQGLWQEPMYRNVWCLLKEFGDAEIASLIAPRGLAIEHSPAPKVDGPPSIPAGRAGGAAPGKIGTTDTNNVVEEIARAKKLAGPLAKQISLESGPAADGLLGPGSEQALNSLAAQLGVQPGMSPASSLSTENRKSFDPVSMQKRQVEELTNYLQRLQRYSDRTRDEFFLNKVYGKGPEAFIEGANKYRERFRKEAIGELNDPLVPPSPKTRKVYDEPKWTGYEVVLDVLGELHAWGILCLPKDIKPGERRPAVVCQHGLEGVPRDVVERNNPAYQYYKAFAAELAEQGFVTFAPYNLYRGGDRFRLLQRKANPLGMSLFSIIARQHEQILNWLGGLPQVDKSRIAFYGLSYGGKSAMRLPALLPGYCLSICSGDFNDWVRKITSLEFVGSYMFTPEWEIFEFDLGSTFNYAEMAYLIFPRPFMVERGHHDGVGLDPWVSYEYAKVRWLYANLGLPDKTEIEYFNGPHCIHGVGTYEFLHKHLGWPTK